MSEVRAPLLDDPNVKNPQFENIFLFVFSLLGGGERVL